jgi:hypothetical protein
MRLINLSNKAILYQSIVNFTSIILLVFGKEYCRTLFGTYVKYAFKYPIFDNLMSIWVAISYKLILPFLVFILYQIIDAIFISKILEINKINLFINIILNLILFYMIFTDKNIMLN